MTAITAAAAAPAEPVRFACHVEGAKLLNPAMSEAAVCARFKQEVDAALGHPTRQVAALPERTEHASAWVRAEVRFTRAGVASATLTEARHGGVRHYPEQSIAQSDRPLGPNIVDQLIREVVQNIRVR